MHAIDSVVAFSCTHSALGKDHIFFYFSLVILHEFTFLDSVFVVHVIT